MFCVCISDPDVNNCIEILKGENLAEIRIDLIRPSENDLKRLFSQPLDLIATCREGYYNDNQRKSILKKAIDFGAKYIDLEIEVSSDYKQDIISYARQKGIKLIISYHNFESTPEIKVLKNIVEQAFAWGADIVKLACQCNNEEDAARMLSLYDDPRNIISIGMGEKGKITRLSSLYLGAPFTFVSSPGNKQTAPGQFTKESILKMIEIIDKS